MTALIRRGEGTDLMGITSLSRGAGNDRAELIPQKPYPPHVMTYRLVTEPTSLLPPRYSRKARPVQASLFVEALA